MSTLEHQPFLSLNRTKLHLQSSISNTNRNCSASALVQALRESPPIIKILGPPSLITETMTIHQMIAMIIMMAMMITMVYMEMMIMAVVVIMTAMMMVMVMIM